MNYPIFKKNVSLDEYDCILSENKLISVRNGEVKTFITVENKEVINKCINDLENSTKKEFMKNLAVVVNKRYNK